MVASNIRVGQLMLNFLISMLLRSHHFTSLFAENQTQPTSKMDSARKIGLGRGVETPLSLCVCGCGLREKERRRAEVDQR